MGASKQEQSAQGEKTAKQLREQLEKDLKALQESCTHKILSDWLDQYWAPGHSTGKKVKVCECCDKVIESKDGYPEIQHYFKGFKIGDKTSKGIITDLYFLTFNEFAGAAKDYEPRYGRKGLIACSINGKTILIGELETPQP